MDLSPGYSLLLSQSATLAANLGFPAVNLVNSSTTVDASWIGTQVAALEPFNSLFVRCSLITSAYSSINGVADGAIASFEPSIVLGGRITYNAGIERDWFPISGEYIRDVAVAIINENSAVIDFGGEIVIVTGRALGGAQLKPGAQPHTMSLTFSVVNRMRHLGAMRPVVARLHHDHVVVHHGQLHHVGEGLFSSLWNAGKCLFGNFLRSDTACALGWRAATFAGDAAKEAAFAGARTLAKKVAQSRLAWRPPSAEPRLRR